jgi:hypothetical protein
VPHAAPGARDPGLPERQVVGETAVWLARRARHATCDRLSHTTVLSRSLDGRDPNGYMGIAWCFGKHDTPFAERAVCGVVRPMTAAGLKRKFQIERFVAEVAVRDCPAVVCRPAQLMTKRARACSTDRNSLLRPTPWAGPVSIGAQPYAAQAAATVEQGRPDGNSLILRPEQGTEAQGGGVCSERRWGGGGGGGAEVGHRWARWQRIERGPAAAHGGEPSRCAAAAAGALLAGGSGDASVKRKALVWFVIHMLLLPPLLSASSSHVSDCVLVPIYI